MPKMRKTTYRYELAVADSDEPVVCEVTPILADLLRAELEGPKHGLTDPKTQSIHFTVLWMWSAGLRTGQHNLHFLEFKAACLNFEVVKAEGAEVQAVPPTGAGSPSATPSSSLESSAIPPGLEPGSPSSAPTGPPVSID